MREFKKRGLNLLEEKGKLIRGNGKEKENLLEVKDLKTYFPVFGGVFRKVIGYVKAVDGVSFSIDKGEVFGLVGETGCGKSTIGKTLVRILNPTFGDIFYYDKVELKSGKEQSVKIDISKLNRKELMPYRSKIQMIFQDPYSSLNPRFTVGDIIEEPLTVHRGKHKENKEIVKDLLKKVGMSEEHIYRYPHEFSGGQRQRIGIARALSTNPELIIADEPVSALDVSIQAQVINLMQDLQDEFRVTYIFISHDLSVVRHIAHRIAVMYLGFIMEMGPADKIHNNPLNPYTKVLLSAVPRGNPRKKAKKPPLRGEVPSSLHKPSGCPFHPRCPIAKDICKKEDPVFEEKERGVFVKCHFPGVF
ncbi:ATP-binding cassette domain-containing protein [candidate division WOR-3 bacterium]|nr:ATP-binding cassette domain-containing protein [candidate division WOR-3 bacterium]